jgi:hypothetical protein
MVYITLIKRKFGKEFHLGKRIILVLDFVIVAFIFSVLLWPDLCSRRRLNPYR